MVGFVMGQNPFTLTKTYRDQGRAPTEIGDALTAKGFAACVVQECVNSVSRDSVTVIEREKRERRKEATEARIRTLETGSRRAGRRVGRKARPSRSAFTLEAFGRALGLGVRG